MIPTDTTDFGYQEIPKQEKTARVQAVFQSVAPKYDLMNDILSVGIHRWWKKLTIILAAVRPGWQILDLAGGTGDLAAALAKRVGKEGLVVLADINEAMLKLGRDRLIDQGLFHQVRYVQANAETLPFPDRYFHLITIGFGLRNVTDKLAALKAMYRVLKPGGRCLVLEFSSPQLPGLKTLYDAYSFHVMPLLGKWIANDEASYRYLAESIRKHPHQKELAHLMEIAGFEQVSYQNLSGGIVALHQGYRF